MNDYRKAVSDGQAEKAAIERDKELRTAERQEQLQKWAADVQSWESNVYRPILDDASEALKQIGGRVHSVNAQPGLYNITVQAGGKGQQIILKIDLKSMLQTVTQGGYGGHELGNISDPKTTNQLTGLLLEAVRKVAS